jgi:ubiquinone/menaquinone biosynthesis C-methylase UbiE
LPVEVWEGVTKKVFLDIGCGNGKTTNYLRFLAGDNEYWGMDTSVKLIEKADKKYSRGHVQFYEDTITDMLCSTSTVDYVMCSFLFHHLPIKIKVDGLKEVYRVLKPGGYLMYIDFGKPTSLWGKIIMNLVTRHGEHIGSQMNNEVLEMMKEQGFSIDRKIIKTTLAGDVYCILARKEL